MINLSICYAWNSIRNSCRNKFKISAPTRKKVKLLDRSYSVLDIQNYFEHQYQSSIINYQSSIIKQHKSFPDDPPIRIYVGKIENNISFKIKTGYYLQLLMLETIKLLGSTKIK